MSEKNATNVTNTQFASKLWFTNNRKKKLATTRTNGKTDRKIDRQIKYNRLKNKNALKCNVSNFFSNVKLITRFFEKLQFANFLFAQFEKEKESACAGNNNKTTKYMRN